MPNVPVPNVANAYPDLNADAQNLQQLMQSQQTSMQEQQAALLMIERQNMIKNLHQIVNDVKVVPF